MASCKRWLESCSPGCHCGRLHPAVSSVAANVGCRGCEDLSSFRVGRTMYEGVAARAPRGCCPLTKCAKGLWLLCVLHTTWCVQHVGAFAGVPRAQQISAAARVYVVSARCYRVQVQTSCACVWVWVEGNESTCNVASWMSPTAGWASSKRAKALNKASSGAEYAHKVKKSRLSSMSSRKTQVTGTPWYPLTWPKRQKCEAVHKPLPLLLSVAVTNTEFTPRSPSEALQNGPGGPRPVDVPTKFLIASTLGDKVSRRIVTSHSLSCGCITRACAA